MELVKGGSLKEFLLDRQKKNIKTSDEEASTIMRNLLRALAYLHTKNIIHRDLKPGILYGFL
jgi:serine/threonine protein kinase